MRGGGPFRLRLEFSRPVEVFQVRFGSQEVRVSGSGAAREGSFSPPPQGSLTTLEVDAVDPVTRLKLDDPRTLAIYEPSTRRWEGYEPGPDRNHQFQVGPPPSPRLGGGG